MDTSCKGFKVAGHLGPRCPVRCWIIPLIAVVEWEERTVGQKVVKRGNAIVDRRDETEYHYTVRCLERLALGTPYSEVASRVGPLAAAVREKARENLSKLYVDATGVGQPVSESASRLRTASWALRE